MNICAASLHPRVLSGEIDSLAGLSRALMRRGHSVSVVAPFATDGLLDGPLTGLDDGSHGLLLSATRMFRALPRIIARSRSADILHLSLPTPAFGWVGDVVQTFTSTRVVAGFEGHLASASEALQAKRLERAWRTYLPLWGVNNGLFGRLTWHHCAAYVVSSAFQCHELTSLGWPAARIHVIPNIIETAGLDATDQRAARQRLGLPLEAPLIGYLGHFNDGKGVDVLAEAFAGLADRRTDVNLVLAWSGQGDPAPVRRHLRRLESRVSWLGKTHVGTFLSAIDALALPYRSSAGQEAFPVLVLEALHVGCPLVVSDLPILREIVGPELASLAAPNSAVDLRRCLEHLLDRPDLRARMVANQRSLGRRAFAPDVLAERYEQLYVSVAVQSTATERAA